MCVVASVTNWNDLGNAVSKSERGMEDNVGIRGLGNRGTVLLTATIIKYDYLSVLDCILRP